MWFFNPVQTHAQHALTHSQPSSGGQPANGNWLSGQLPAQNTAAQNNPAQTNPVQTDAAQAPLTNTATSASPPAQTPGQMLTDRVSTQFPNSVSIFGLYEHLLKNAGGDSMLTAEEGAAAFSITPPQMERIIRNVVGPDAERIPVDSLMETFTGLANNMPLRLISDQSIDMALSELMGSPDANNFFERAGPDGNMDFELFGEFATEILEETGQTFTLGQLNRLFNAIAGSDGRLEAAEFAGGLGIELDENGSFDWELTQGALMNRLLELGPDRIPPASQQNTHAYSAPTSQMDPACPPPAWMPTWMPAWAGPSGPAWSQPSGQAWGQPSGPAWGQPSGPAWGQPSGPAWGQPSGQAWGQAWNPPSAPAWGVQGNGPAAHSGNPWR